MIIAAGKASWRTSKEPLTKLTNLLLNSVGPEILARKVSYTHQNYLRMRRRALNQKERQ